MVGVVFLGLGEVQHQHEHISVDLVYERLAPLARWAMELGSLVLSVLLASVVTWQLLAYAGRMLSSGEATTVLALPIAPALGVAALGFGIFSLALLIDALAALRARPPLRSSQP